jgi:tetratricopeptide (TPR) repeat protein
MFLNNQVPPNSPLKETVYRNFQQNLDDIVGFGRNSGATVMLNTVAVNLKDCPPFASMPDGHLSPRDQAQFAQLYTNGLQAAARQEFAAAAGLFERAAQLDEAPAGLQYRWAQWLLLQTNLAGAGEHFRLACDHDALPFRADSRINTAIRAERDQHSGSGLMLFDAATALAPGEPKGLCGDETFFEHVHFDFDGRYRLGLAWAKHIESMLLPKTNGWASQAVCEQKLGLSAWNRAQVIHFMVERMEMPPLSNQGNNIPRREALEKRTRQLRAQMSADNSVKTRQEFVNLLKERPEDFYLHENFAVYLELAGDPVAAAEEWLRFRELLPHDCLGYYQAGRLLPAQQRFGEAEASLRTALAIRPSRTEAWIELGNVLALQKKYAEALASYDQALKQDPQNGQTLLRRGKVLANTNRHAEAMESYRAAIQVNTTDGLAHHELGLELAGAGQLEAAGKELAEAARLIPSGVAARFDYGVLLMKQQRWEEAQREFEAVVRLEPGNTRAQKTLETLRAGRQRAP